MNEEHLRRYARLLVELGVDLRPRQPLYVAGQVAHRRLVALLTEVAYEAGSGPVETRLLDPLQHAAVVRHGRLEDIELIHTPMQVWYNDVIRHGGAFVGLQGPELPGVWEELDRTHPDRQAVYRLGLRTAQGAFFRYGLQGLRCSWVVAPCPTRGWAQTVYPDLPAEAAFEQLAARIFELTFANREDAFERAAARERRLKTRCRRLDELGIEKIHVSGGHSDLWVGLSPKARWQGGRLRNDTGQACYCNMPSVEVLTTPDRRLTEGRLAATRPFRLPGGPVVQDLVVRFQGGRVSDFEASRGGEAFESWLNVPGARYLGEFALVGQDSPIARSGLFFDLSILDENASSHVALGQAYTRLLEGSDSMSPRELEELGCNTSAVHTDVMFGSDDVTVVAVKSREGEVVLMERGRWAPRFAADAGPRE